jgi:hypothetical protein
MPNTACSSPAGNGALIGWPLTKCLSGTGIVPARPGSVALPGSRLLDFFMKENMETSSPRITP